MPFTRMLSLVVPVFAFSFMYFYKKKNRIEEGVYANTHKKVCKHSSKSYENLLPRFIIDKTMCLLPCVLVVESHIDIGTKNISS